MKLICIVTLEPDMKMLAAERWRLMSPLYWTSTRGPETIPIGFVTDRTSGYFEGKHSVASIIHDWLYKTAPCSRRQADRIMLDGMRFLRVNRFRRWIIYRALRIGGWRAWNQHRKSEEL